MPYSVVFFFFQAEDGIRDYKVTGVQTCALPICAAGNGLPRSAEWCLRPAGRTAVAALLRLLSGSTEFLANACGRRPPSQPQRGRSSTSSKAAEDRARVGPWVLQHNEPMSSSTR